MKIMVLQNQCRINSKRSKSPASSREHLKRMWQEGWAVDLLNSVDDGLGAKIFVCELTAPSSSTSAPRQCRTGALASFRRLQRRRLLLWLLFKRAHSRSSAQMRRWLRRHLCMRTSCGRMKKATCDQATSIATNDRRRLFCQVPDAATARILELLKGAGELSHTGMTTS